MDRSPAARGTPAAEPPGPARLPAVPRRSRLAALRFYTVVASAGAIIMALEILSSRILAPAFGSSVYVWGSIISVFLAALAAGYGWGGRLADRRPRLAVVGRLVLGAALFQALLLYFGTGITGWLGEATDGSPGGTLLTATLLFAPPSVLLATVSPYAIRLAARDLAHLGDTAGRLFALSTAGSLAGTLAATFVLIPYLDLHRILALLLGATAATSLVAIGRERSGRLDVAAAALLLVLAGLAAASPVRHDGGRLALRVTPYQTLEVVERDGARRLLSNGVPQAGVRLDDGRPAYTYLAWTAAALLVEPEIDRVLVLGMGAATMGGVLREVAPGVEIDYVDLDPAVPELARRYFGFEPGPRDRVHVADGRRFLAGSDERWDLVVLDTYIGLSVPFHMTTLEFFAEVERHLAPGGVVAINLAASLDQPFSRALLATVAARFSSLYALAVPGSRNVLLLATDAPEPPDEEEMAVRAARLDAERGTGGRLAAIARSRIPVRLEGDVDLLSDAFAPADHLVSLRRPADGTDR